MPASYQRAVGCCSICRKPINGECLVKGFELICLECDNDFYTAHLDRFGEEDSIYIPVRTCKYCGEEFDNVGDFLAHCRTHKRQERRAVDE